LAQLFTEEAIYKKTSQELTALLYEACIENLESAVEAIHEKNFIAANEKLQKANDILYRLGAGINYEAGIIADQLDALYNYMANELIRANVNKDAAIIKTVITILEKLSASWHGALQSNKNGTAKTRLRTSAYEKNMLTIDQS
jgi:flagellar protein FliS